MALRRRETDASFAKSANHPTATPTFGVAALRAGEGPSSATPGRP